jgi:hypothetical protein
MLRLFWFLFFRLQKLTRIPYRHRPRKAMHMFEALSESARTEMPGCKKNTGQPSVGSVRIIMSMGVL